MIFYLGTHKPNWLEMVYFPLFISWRRFPKRKMPIAQVPWCLDSGAFTELGMHGKWTVSPQEYSATVRRLRDSVGMLEWAAIQDWMCEPYILAKTGLSVVEHQRRTIESYETLLALEPTLPWTPVLQGWTLDDYLRHLEMYRALGLPLDRVVGVGSVCRRQESEEIRIIIETLYDQGLKIHGFGVKTAGLEKYASYLHSADSMAWSFQARRLQKPLDGCVGHINCANCLRFAIRWRNRVCALLP